MPTKNTRRIDVSRGNRTAPSTDEIKPVALTVKVDENIYIRLSTLRAKRRTTNQEILREALLDFLKRSGA